MSTIASELSKTRETKAALQAALKAKGQSTTGLVFGDWPPLVGNITGESGELQTKTAIPAATDVEVTPDDGIAGLLKVLIDADINHKPYNIMDGITIHGVTGTAKPYVVTDGTWPFPSTDIEPGPHEPPTEEEVDNAVKEDDPDVNTEDKMVLVDNEGNVTTGYLYTEEDCGLMDYGGYLVLPDKPEHDQDIYPYEIILLKDDAYVFVCSASTFKRGLFSVTSDGPYISFGADPDTGEYWALTESGESFSESGTIKWTNAEITGTYITAVPDPYEPVSAGFALTGYRFETTEFEAIGWRRISKHTTGELAGTITKDSFVRRASTGWNYLRHLRSCAREKLYYRGHEVWPSKPVFAGSVTVPAPDSLNGGMKILITYEGDDYTYQLKAGDRVRLTVDGAIFEYTVGASSTNSDGDYVRTFGNYWLCVEVGSTHVSDDGGNFAVQEDGTWLVLYARNRGTYNIRIEKVAN